MDNKMKQTHMEQATH